MLLKPPPAVGWGEVAWIVITASAGIAALAGGAQNWVLLRCQVWERLALIAAGLLLVYPRGWADASGLSLIALVLVSQGIRARRSRTPA